jgi:hypothetical protein
VLGLDLTTEDLGSWAERRLERDVRALMLAQAKRDTPQTPPVEPEGVSALSDEILDALAQIAAAICAFVNEMPPEMRYAQYAKAAGATPDRQLSPESADTLRGSLSSMPDSLQEGFMSWLKSQGDSPLKWEKAQSLAEDIASKRDIDDPERFGAWLYWVSKV